MLVSVEIDWKLLGALRLKTIVPPAAPPAAKIVEIDWKLLGALRLGEVKAEHRPAVFVEIDWKLLGALRPARHSSRQRWCHQS